MNRYREDDYRPTPETYHAAAHAVLAVVFNHAFDTVTVLDGDVALTGYDNLLHLNQEHSRIATP